MGKASKTPGTVHYAWILLAAVTTAAAVSSGLRLSFGVILDPLAQEFGWSRGAISLAYSISFLAAVPLTFLAGWTGETFGTRRMVMFGSLTVVLGMYLTSRATNLWQFYVFNGVLVGGLGTALFMTLLPVTVTRWFHARLGLAMGIMWTAQSWGPMILSPVLRWAIEAVGWRTSFAVLGFILGGIILAASFFIRNQPEDKGLAPYGMPVEKQGAATNTAPIGVGSLTLAQARRTPAFWSLIGLHFIGCVSHSIPLAHMVSMATAAGIPGVAAAGLLSALSLTSMGSRFGMSLLSEAKGSRVTLGLALLLQTTPLLILLWARDLWVFYLAALLFGIGFGGEMVGFPMFNRQLYGVAAPLTRIYSYQMVGALTGMALGGWLGGFLIDVTGGYVWPVLASVITGYAGLVAILWLPHHRTSTAPLLAV